MSNIWVSGVVAVRDKHPYVQLSNEKGMIAQFSMSEARQVANDILTMCARTEADAMIVKFFAKMNLPDNGAVAILQDFRDFRHELDMEKAERDPDAIEGEL
jgi:hypothetical protein